MLENCQILPDLVQQPHTEGEDPAVRPHREVRTSSLQRWPATTLYTPEDDGSSSESSGTLLCTKPPCCIPSHLGIGPVEPTSKVCFPSHFTDDHDRVFLAHSNQTCFKGEEAEDGRTAYLAYLSRIQYSGEVEEEEVVYMERFRRKCEGDRKASSRGSDEDVMRIAHESVGGGRFRTDFAEKRHNGYRIDAGGGGGVGGFDGDSQDKYDRWKMRTTSEATTASDGTFSAEVEADDGGDGVDNDDQVRRRRFSSGDHQQTTFSDSSVDRRWRFDSDQKHSKSDVEESVGRWRVSFEEGELTTNIDDLIQDTDQDDRWAFGNQNGHESIQMCSVDVWTPARIRSESEREGFVQNNGSADKIMHPLRFEDVYVDVKDTEDTQSVDTLSTDTDSVFRRDEVESLSEKRRKFLMEMALRGKGHAINRLTSGCPPNGRDRAHQRLNSWQTAKVPLPSSPRNHRERLENLTKEGARKEHKRTRSWRQDNVPEWNHQDVHGQKAYSTLPSENKRERQRITSKHYTSSSQDNTSHPFLAKDTPEHPKNSQERTMVDTMDGWRLGETADDEDTKTEQRKRLNAWVSSIQTHWDSTGSSCEFPFSFEDNFQGWDEESDIFCDFSDFEYEEHEVELFMTDDDKRFGFSVIGGYDEGIAPRVDEVTMGSPADRAELEVGDEIVEVNGKCVDRCAHSEIISHIHQCIRSKSIRLRVKRLKEGEKVPAISKVHDAYIIAVEETARRKLEDASANHRVIPVDISQSPPHKQEEAVTAFRAEPVSSSPGSGGAARTQHHQQTLSPELQQEVQQPQNSLTQSLQKSPSSTSPPKPLRQKKSAPEQQQQQQHQDIQPQEPGPREVISLVEQNPVYAPSMPVAEKKRKSSPSKTGGLNGSVEALEMNGMMEKERESPRKGKGGKGKKGEGRGGKATSNPDTPLIEDMMNHGGFAPNGKTSSHNSLNHSSHDLNMYDLDSDPGFQHSEQNSFSDSGPHREMAIDCPDSFVATVKTPPRYPPPQNAGPATATSVPRVPPTTPSKSTDSVKDKARTEATLNDAAFVVAGGSQPKPTSEQLERLRKHQDELRKRREEETRQQQEQDFLRSSLRGSKKLQALENRKMAQAQQLAPPIGIINTAFVDAEEEDEEGELVDDIDGMEQSVPVERYLKKNTGVEDLLSTLHHIRSRLNSADNTSTSNGSQEVFFLKQLFHNAQFQQAVAMHQKMVDVTSRSPQPRPLGTDSQELVADVSSSVPVRGSEPAVKELVTLLNKPFMKNLLKAHDEVAERQTHPIIHTSESDLIDYPLVQYGEESVKIIHLEKTNEHLGATVRNEGDSVIIARIVKGGAAEKSGLLHEGDEILDVNGIDMRGKNVNEVSEILANMSGTITFMIIPAHTCVEESVPKSGEIMHLRALFNYDPEDDPYIPCRELGISFLKGDILHAIQLTDPNWWQAHREGEEEHHMLAGLIPSKSFQEQRESVRQQLTTEGKENKKRSRMCACGRKERKKKKKKKSLYNGGVGEDTEEILTYEEVTRYYPQPNRKRPIVLVGPADIGRQELRERFMESDFDRFAAAVPHTSRTPVTGEHNGKDYHFISRSVFEADMLSGKFIEYGEYQNNLYGTSVEAVRQVINQGRICILNLQPESLKILRDTDLKPYIIFVSPPNMEKLRQLHMALGRPRPTDEQLKDVIEKGREMEEAFSHFFDYILVNMDLDRSYEELLQEINRIETEPQWVPIVWVNNYM